MVANVHWEPWEPRVWIPGTLAEMIFSAGLRPSDDNGEAEVGDAAYFFPKLNLECLPLRQV